MGKILVLAEKPSVGRDIARVLKYNQDKEGYLEGKTYIVTWALGHLVTLAEPEDYDERYRTWSMEDLPMLPSPLKLTVIKKTAKQYHRIKKFLHRRDVQEVVLVTDAGRGGELVGRWILEMARVNKPLKRLWISSVTDRAIREGFQRLRDGKEYQNLYHSAIARAEADWYVGINATRALTRKVQCPAFLRKGTDPHPAYNRTGEEEIKNFVPRTYYSLEASVKGVKFSWQKGHSFDREKVERVLSRIKQADLRLKGWRGDQEEPCALLYDLTELQGGQSTLRLLGQGNLVHYAEPL